MFELVDVDVSGVHLVGSPANRRKFAIVKSATREPTVKRSELLALLKGGDDDQIDAKTLSGLFAGDSGLAKKLGLHVTIEKAATEPAPAGDAPPVTLDKSKLPPDLAAAITALEKQANDATRVAAQLLQERTAEKAQALRKRAEAIQAAGYELDVEKATEVEVAALEKAHKAIFDRLEKAGVTHAFGDARRPDRAPTLAQAVSKEVRRRLGREPFNDVEDARTRQQIYRENPGLLTAVTKEERTRAA